MVPEWTRQVGGGTAVQLLTSIVYKVRSGEMGLSQCSGPVERTASE